MIKSKKIIAIGEMFLMISFSFAVAFLMSGEMKGVNAEYFYSDILATGTSEPGALYSTADLASGSQAAAGSGVKFPAGDLGLGGGTKTPALPKTTPIANPGVTAPAASNTLGGFGQSGISSLFTATGTVGGLLSGLLWGAAVGGGLYLVGKMFGMTPNNAKALGVAGGVGMFSGYYIAQGLGYGAGWGLLGGLAIGGVIFVAMYKKEKTVLVKFECMPWEAPIGGHNCGKCNENPLMPCSEYRCKSLGQACQIVNPGTDKELCVWVNPGDVNAPVIKPLESALGPGTLRYIPDNAVNPPNEGVVIEKVGGKRCLQPYTPLNFGVYTVDGKTGQPEPSQCKIDIELKKTFDEMILYMDNDNSYGFEHTQALKVPEKNNEAGSAPTIMTGNSIMMYVRCRDANGNENVGAFAFRFCVDDAPDVMSPEIVGTSIDNNGYVQYNVDKVPITVNVNEPSECKWSRQDKDYNSMENEMVCSTQSYQVNSELNYDCNGDLTGIKNKEDNVFYFRCMDMSTAPGGRNEMRTSFRLVLKGTEPLVIKSVGPGGNITDSVTQVSVNLTVETAAGAEEGKAKCSFSEDVAEPRTFNLMDVTGDYKHSQIYDFPEGQHFITFQCTDAGGNSYEAMTNFTVNVDKQAALIARAYRDGDKLKLITNEEAQCAYSPDNCLFDIDEAAKTTPLNYESATKRSVHVAAWNYDTVYHIKCQDLRRNAPMPDACSIIVRGSQL